MDYAEEEAKMEHLAVRFKTAETKNEFQKVFEDCQAKLRDKPTTKEDATATTVTRAKTVSNGDH